MPAKFDQALVRRTGRGWKRQGGLPLCGVCGLQNTCQVPGSFLALAEALGATAQVVECRSYRPVIGFADRAGLQGVRFNTFRRGKGWFNRAPAGTVVGLYDLAADDLFAVARVIEAHAAPLGDLLPVHAHENHLMLARAPGDPVAKLAAELVKLYGRTYAALDQEYSVLVMEEVT